MSRRANRSRQSRRSGGTTPVVVALAALALGGGLYCAMPSSQPTKGEGRAERGTPVKKDASGENTRSEGPADAAAAADPWADVEPVSMPPAVAASWASRELRGFGAVSASLRKPEDPKDASVLVITCEDAQRAKLAQAKYLSDLAVLPGVRDTALRGEVAARVVEGQGAIAALRSGPVVTILAAPDVDGLTRLVATVVRDADEPVTSRPEVDVPMWLDRWDKFGFRFYYRTWERPRGTSTASYDVTKEFEYAQRMDRSGMVVWTDVNGVDTAEGLNNDAFWDWATRGAREKMIPAGINLGVGNPVWLTNRYRDQLEMKMPQFLGNFHKIADPHLGACGRVSWAATTAKDVQLALCQEIVRRHALEPNVTTVLEPHGELNHGNHDIFLDYGPVADESYRRFLKERYGELSTISRRWDERMGSWADVRVPEVASFLGWGPDAVDLQGTWRVRHEELPAGKKYRRGELTYGLKMRKIETMGTPAGWLDADFDDSAWSTIKAPGHDRAMFLEHRPAVYRRSFRLPPGWLRAHPKVWLYVWDLNLGTGDVVKVAVNGKTVGEQTVAHNRPHWGVYEVSGALAAGKNVIAARLPKGYFAYRVYLSGHEPKQYPDLGEAMNARWVDFMDWSEWARVGTARRGMEMIRQVDANRQITLMAPDAYLDGVKQLAVRYGGNFHNTGWMGAFWGDLLPAIMRGARLPFSLEPGGSASDLKGFKKLVGLYSTQGIQGIDYFIHIGNIMWDPEIKAHFEKELKLIKLIGKYHAPTAEVAALYADRNVNLTGYPWGKSPDTNLAGGYWNWNVRNSVRDTFESDGLTPSSFDSGDADRYRVVVDSNTSIMDEALIEDIERYVRAGGTFITWAQSGRHTPTKRDAWPIQRLTGYRVTRIDRHDDRGGAKERRTLRPAPGQDALTGDWSKPEANGLTLERVADDATDLMLWADGTVAVGARRLGKGMIVQVGCKFAGVKIYDRIEPGMRDRAHIAARTRLLTALLRWRGVTPVAARLVADDDHVLMRHYLSNNGLYDVWVLWNQDRSRARSVEVVLDESVGASAAVEVSTSASVPLAGNRLRVDLEPHQTRAYLTPRGRIADAASDWLTLQRDWWRATQPPPQEPLPEPPHRHSVDLCEDWGFKPLADGEDGATFAAADFDDGAWERMRLGVWSLPGRSHIRRAVFRRRFTVPADWSDGEIELWLTSWFANTFADKGRVWLDGKLVRNWDPYCMPGWNPDGVLVAGSTHTVAAEVRTEGTIGGVRGSCWLYYRPAPPARQDLAGMWRPRKDALHFGEAVRFPGDYDADGLVRNVIVPASRKGRNVVLMVSASGPLAGVIVNGALVRRHHHKIGDRWDLNITPWVRFGEENELELIAWDGPGRGTVKKIELGFYEPGTYP